MRLLFSDLRDPNDRSSTDNTTAYEGCRKRTVGRECGRLHTHNIKNKTDWMIAKEGEGVEGPDRNDET
jgi:hypothetical protein